MSEIFLTSDEHYGHRNIIDYCRRPFSSTDEMRETLIKRHNKKVPNSRNYLTIHLGDMFWNSLTRGECADILFRLHGRHAFVYGNHDEAMERDEWLRSQFDFVVGANKTSGVHIISYNHVKISLCHYAMRVWERSHKGSWMLYGHSHNELPVVGKSFDVGVDGHNFEPWSLEEVAARMETLTQHHVITPKQAWPGKEHPSGDQRGL